MFVIAVLLYKVLLDAYVKRHTRGRPCCYSSPHYRLQNDSIWNLKSHTGRSIFFFSSVKVEKNRRGKERYLLQRCDLCYTMLSHMLLLAKLASTPHPTSTFLLQSPNMAQGFKMVIDYILCMAFGSLLYTRGGALRPPFWLWMLLS